MNDNGRQSLPRAAAIVGSALLLLWATLVTIYFFRTNFHALAVFPALLGSYTFSLANSPPLEMAQVLLAAGLPFALGLCVVRLARVQAGIMGRLALAYALGFGLSGIAFVLLTMAGGLHAIPAWILWLLLLGGARALVYTRRGLPPAEPCERTPLPGGWVDRVFLGGAAVMIVLITLATFWHALFFPETYWDSLILYLGYGRMTFLEHAFPFKAEAQVGIGLGANYPHLFSNHAAVCSTLFNHWSDLHARFAAPLAGLCATILIHQTLLILWQSHTTAAAGTLLFRAVPNGIAYSTYASDYAFSMLFIAAFLYCLALHARDRSRGTLALLTLIPAISMHLNYLMGILWIPWALGVIAVAWLGQERQTLAGATRGLLRDRFLWIVFLAGLALASPWYIRNLMLTNNPVYAFFPNIFTSSIRVNRDVLKSAELEWFRNGDGVGRVAEIYHDFRTGAPREESDPAFRREATVGDRVRSSFLFWVGFDVVRLHEDSIETGPWMQRLLHLLRVGRVDPAAARELGPDLRLVLWPHGYKMMTLFPAWFFPALLLAAVFCLYRAASRRERGELFAVRAVTLGGAAAVALLLLAYEYLIADLYLYQIIGIVVPAAVVATLAFHAMERIGGRAGAILRAVAFALVLVQGIAPGLAFGLMNFKFFGTRELDGQLFSQLHLDAFRNPGMPRELFYRLCYGEDVAMWNYLNEQLRGERLLTHENRHYVIDPSITLVHLDDWDMQQGYDLPDAQATAAFLRQHNIRYYLRVPNEANHVINRRLGMERLEQAGRLREMYRAGGNVLFELVEK